MELTQVRGNADAAGEMIERLTNSLAFTIAICAQGDPDRMNTMIEGVNAYLLEAATGHQRAGQILR